MPADESIRTLSVTATNTAAFMRLIHCSLRRTSSRLRISAQMEVGIDGCRDLPQASGEGRGSAAAHPNRDGRGLHLPGRDRMVQLELLESCIPGLTPVGKSLTMPTISYQRPDSSILRRRGSVPVDITDAPAEGIAAENPLGERLVDHDRSTFGRLLWRPAGLAEAISAGSNPRPARIGTSKVRKKLTSTRLNRTSWTDCSRSDGRAARRRSDCDGKGHACCLDPTRWVHRRE